MIRVKIPRGNVAELSRIVATSMHGSFLREDCVKVENDRGRGRRRRGGGGEGGELSAAKWGSGKHSPPPPALINSSGASGDIEYLEAQGKVILFLVKLHGVWSYFSILFWIWGQLELQLVLK